MASEHRRCGSLERMHVEKSLSLVCRLVICVLSAVSWEALASCCWKNLAAKDGEPTGVPRSRKPSVSSTSMVCVLCWVVE